MAETERDSAAGKGKSLFRRSIALTSGGSQIGHKNMQIRAK